MNVFFCALRLKGERVQKPELFDYLARMRRIAEFDWECDGAFGTAALNQRSSFRPLLARHRGILGVGDVRLDNRAEIARLANCDMAGASDLRLVLAAIDQCGSDVIPKLLGDFAFVAWDARAQKLLAARDAFGVKPLYYARVGEYLMLASRLELLVREEAYDLDYIANTIIGLPNVGPRTIWRGIHALEPGAFLLQRGSVTVQSRYWDAARFQPTLDIDENAASEEFRRLFTESVRLRMAGEGETWAQLSGGLDSSSVVSVAQQLHATKAANNLAGTITLVDSLGDGDERRYSDAVLARYPLPNAQICDYWPWRDDRGQGPPATAEPSALFPFYARDSRMVDTVRQHGGRVLLSGLGSDHYLFGSTSYVADMLVRGALKDTMREVLGWAMATRRSVWSTARRLAINPLVMNSTLGRRRQYTRVPRWIPASFARQHGMANRVAELKSPRAATGCMFATHAAVELKRLASWIDRGPFEERLEMRYPFLYRPLVEFSLSLPAHFRIRPGNHKWILREAMRGITPEEVLTRKGKGGIDARILWSLQHERETIQAIATNPILAEFGCIDVAEFRRTLESARQGVYRNTVHVFSVLSLESWLRVRAGRWPMRRMETQTAA